MHEERSDQGEAKAAITEITEQVDTLVSDPVSSLMLDVCVRQTILQCWIMLPERRRSPGNVEQEIQRRLQGALKDLTSGATLLTSSERAQPTKPATDERLARIRAKYPKAYEPWTAEDDRALKNEYNQGANITRLSGIFERQPSAIRSRLLKLGIAKSTSER